MRHKFIIGFNKDMDLVIGEYEIKAPVKYVGNERVELAERQFSASFNVVRPFEFRESDLEDRAADMLDGYDKSTLYELCERNDCKPSELPGLIASMDGIEGVYDISLYPESFMLAGREFYFESGSCGQHDVREQREFDPEEDEDENIRWFVRPEFLGYFLELWDNYHLKRIPENVIEEFYERIEDEYREQSFEFGMNFPHDNDDILERKWVERQLHSYINENKL